MDWSLGVNSGALPTIEGPQNPHGLKRSSLSWLENGTVRGGGISPRLGYSKAVEDFVADTGLFQGAAMYSPVGAVPYMIIAISGRIFRINVWTDNTVTEITIAGDPNPPLITKFYFCQAEEFMIIQAGDFVTNALVWDGNTLIRMGGAAAQEVPAGAAMDYYMGRLWVQNGNRFYTAGDIVGGTSGTAPYGFRDSILHWTENAWLAGGGYFIVPSNAGSIRSLDHTANMDTALGEGLLIIGCRDAVYSLNVPVTRLTWNAAIENNQPIQRVIQNRYGPTSDRSVVPSNGDLFYQAYDGVRSLQMAVRYFHQWGQTSISKNENRVWQLNNRAFASFASGIEFDNRLLQTVLPFQTPVGVAFQGIMPLDFDLITSLQDKLPPAWEGMLEGLDYMQLLEAESGGLQRAFTVVHSRETGRIQIWEMTTSRSTDFAGPGNQSDIRVGWYFETPAFTWGDSFQLKELESAEIWVDRLSGTVDFQAYYRPDSGCYKLWHQWRICSARNPCEDIPAGLCYPEENTYCQGYKANMRLPKPPVECATQVGRPSNQAYQFQFKLVIKGYCRIRGILLHALPRMEGAFDSMVC